jgi:hypothetical protein
VVGEFVDHRDRDLLDDLLVGVADLQQALSEDRDGVRQCAAVAGVAVGQRDALVQADQVGILGMAVGDQHDDVVDRRGEFGRNEVERIGDQFLEALRAHADRH